MGGRGGIWAQKKQPKPNPFLNSAPTPLTIELVSILEGYQDEDDPRTYPSPSGAEDCRRRIVYLATDEPRTERTDVATVLAQEQGKVHEPIAEELFLRAGYTVVGDQVEVPGDEIGCPGGGHCDWILNKDGEDMVGECKRLGWYSYLSFVRDGLLLGHKSYYSQVQLYMAGLGLKKAVLIALSADFSAIRKEWRLRRYDMDTLPPPLWTEEVTIDLPYVEELVERNKKQVQMIERKWGPQDFDPFTTNFPCGYCGFKEKCIDDGPD